MIRRKYQEFGAIAFAAALPLALAACGQNPEANKQAAAPPPAVTVANPIQRTIVDQDEYVGRFVAVDSVEVRARVSGYLEKIHFTDGQTVKEGDLLFTIDKRPFQTALDQAKRQSAALPRRASFRRRRSGASRAIGARQDHHRTDLRSAHAGQARRGSQVAAQEAAVRQAELDLSSPICARR